MTAIPMRSRSFQRAVGKYATQRNYSICTYIPQTNGIIGSISNNNQHASTANIRQTKRSFRTSAIIRKKDFYDVLGVSKQATKEEIKKNYRELAKKCHPDLNKDDKSAGTKFRELSEAYEVLEDDGKRQMYDNYGHAGIDGSQQQQRGGGGGDPFAGFGGNPFSGFQGGGFRYASGGGEDIFDMLNKAMEREQQAVGKDVRVRLKLSFLEAVTGCNKDIKYEYMAKDSKKGQYKKSVNVSVDIPPGVEQGMTVKMAGQGTEAQTGRHKGDLFIELDVENDPYFKREKYDVYTDLHITMTQAVLGCRVDVLTLNGMVEMKVKPGTQPGTTLSLNKKGIRHLNTPSMTGNQYVKVHVEIPSSITEKQKELIEQFAAEEGNKVESSAWSKKIGGDVNSAWTRLKSFMGQSEKVEDTTTKKKQSS